MPFFHQLLTSGGHRDAQSRIFEFLLFWPKKWPFLVKNLRKSKILTKNGHFSAKKAKSQKSEIVRPCGLQR